MAFRSNPSTPGPTLVLCGTGSSFARATCCELADFRALSPGLDSPHDLYSPWASVVLPAGEWPAGASPHNMSHLRSITTLLGGGTYPEQTLCCCPGLLASLGGCHRRVLPGNHHCVHLLPPAVPCSDQPACWGAFTSHYFDSIRCDSLHPVKLHHAVYSSVSVMKSSDFGC